MKADGVQNALNDTIKKVIERSDREFKKKNESPYFMAFHNFESELSLLRELNKKLLKSARKTMAKELEKSARKLGSSTNRTLGDIKKAIDLILSAIKEDRNGEKNKERSVKINLSKKAQGTFLELMRAYSYPTGLSRFTRSMSLVYLVVEFESFLRSILQTTYKARPEVLMYCQKTMTYGELIISASIDDTKQQVIDKESSAVINQDIEEVNQYLEQKFNLDLAKSKYWKEFKERFYRRNVVVHNSGMVDRLYRLRTGYRGKDKILDITESYLRDSINLFEGIAFEISSHFYEKFK
jgi:hypothetical protein